MLSMISVSSILVFLTLAVGGNASVNTGDPTRVCHDQYQNRAVVGRPLVPDAETAKAIFLAVESKLLRPDLANFPNVVATETSDHWQVGRDTRDPNIRGGGQLNLEISKCSAAVSNIVFEN